MRSTSTTYTESPPDVQGAASVIAAPERLFDRLLDDLNVIVWEAEHAPARCLFVSQCMAAIVGYPVARCREPHFWSMLLDPDEGAQLAALCSAALITGAPQTFDHRLRSAGGRASWFRTTLHALIDDAETPARVLALLTDITLQKQAEAALHESEARFREIAETSTDMISRHGLPARRADWPLAVRSDPS
jgi:PAS domain S-box-containing protein